MKIKSLRQVHDLAGKRVFLRADFNVSLKKGKVKEDYKIIAGLPTLRYLLRYKCAIAVATHLGDPGGKRVKELSTAPIAKSLAKSLGKKVIFVPECTGPKVEKALAALKPGEILFLENLRYHKGEEKNDKEFAEALAKPFDLAINNAFAVCHREHASVVALKKYLPTYAGLLVEEEVESLHKTLTPRQPLVVIIGGAKISTKLPLIANYLKQADHILVGGATANDFIKGLGFEVGRSVVGKDEKMLQKAVNTYRKAGNKKIVLPVDFVVSGNLKGKGRVEIKSINKIGKEDYILDIGPKTIHLYSQIIKKANTLVWNGPMGYFEEEKFKHGTMSIARLVASRASGRAFGVVGGGETVEALRKTDMLDHVDWVSTGGGAMLDYLAGLPMPGLKGIIK